jgi:hypothetical protein
MGGRGSGGHNSKGKLRDVPRMETAAQGIFVKAPIIIVIGSVVSRAQRGAGRDSAVPSSLKHSRLPRYLNQTICGCGAGIWRRCCRLFANVVFRLTHRNDEEAGGTSSN